MVKKSLKSRWHTGGSLPLMYWDLVHRRGVYCRVYPRASIGMHGTRNRRRATTISGRHVLDPLSSKV
jgi:hypothetical protein